MFRRRSARSRASLLLCVGLTAGVLAGCAQEDPPANENTITQEPTTQESEAASPSAAATAPESEETTPAAEPLSINPDGILGGSAAPEFDDGEPGIVSTVYVGPYDTNSTRMPFVLRNNTDEAVAQVEATVTVRDAEGNLAATTTSQGTTPQQIPSGGLAMAYIYLAQSEVPEGATFEFSFETYPANQSSGNLADLRVTEVAETGDGLTGTATNETGTSLEGPYSLEVYCFEGGALTLNITDYADDDGPIGPDGTVSFSADFYDWPCPTYLVGVTGWFS